MHQESQELEGLFLVLVDDRETGVGRGNNEGQELFRRIVDVDHVHLGTRDHDVPHLGLGYLEHAFDHGKRIGIEQIPLIGGMEKFYELVPIFRFAHQQRAQPLKPARLSTRIVHTWFCQPLRG